MVSPFEFFFGTVWDPRFAAAEAAAPRPVRPAAAPCRHPVYRLRGDAFRGADRAFAAIYMAEYASPRLRSTAKLFWKVLAGIPTIVYGFFALVHRRPFLRDISAQLNGLVTGNYQNFIQAQSVITPASSWASCSSRSFRRCPTTIITQVPRALRDGSLGLGATRSKR